MSSRYIDTSEGGNEIFSLVGRSCCRRRWDRNRGESRKSEGAQRSVERLENHYTPKHASWLDMAETELSVLGRQCLNRRISDRETLTREVAAWEKERNATVVTVDWRFTTADARIKLKRLYPSIQPK